MIDNETETAGEDLRAETAEAKRQSFDFAARREA